MANIAQGTVCKILARNDVKPHKVRYYLERRDEAFEAKMAEVLCVYREVAVLRASNSASSDVAIISYDEKPGIQAIANTDPTCRRSRGRMRALRATMNTSATAH